MPCNSIQYIEKWQQSFIFSHNCNYDIISKQLLLINIKSKININIFFKPNDASRFFETFTKIVVIKKLQLMFNV